MIRIRHPSPPPSSTIPGSIPLISAIVSTYNAERFIRGRIRDLLEQTIADRLEIIVVDSGSQQGEGAIVKESQERYPNIVYIRTQERETIYSAWNRGVKAARGAYLTNANTDDRLRPDALEVMARVLDSRGNIDVVYGTQRITDEPDVPFSRAREVDRFDWPEFSVDALHERCCVGSQPMWRRSLHERFGLFDGGLEVAGDYEFWLRVSGGFHRIDECLGVYYRSPKGGNKEYEDQVRTFEETSRVTRKHYVALLAAQTAEVISAQLQEATAAMRPLLASISRGEVSRENTRRLEFLFWKAAMHLEALNRIDDARSLIDQFFRVFNNSPRLAFLLKALGMRRMNPGSRTGGPTVSVVIPCFNNRDVIGETVASVVNQTYANFEIILVNDGSTDGTDEELERIVRQHPGIARVIHQANSGPAASRNNGIAAARGELVLPLDGDDQLAFDFLERTVAEFVHDPGLDVVFTEAVFYGAKNKVWALDDVRLPDLYCHNFLTVTSLFMKALWSTAGGFDPALGGYEDWDFWITLARRGCRFRRIAAPLFLYRHRTTSRNYQANHSDVTLKLAIMRKHPEVYRLPANVEMGLLEQREFIPPVFLRTEKPVQSPAHPPMPGSARKILFVCHDFPPYKFAGAQLYAMTIAQELRAGGIDIRVFYPVDTARRPGMPLFSLVESHYQGLPVYEIVIDQSRHPAFYSKDVEDRFRELLIRERFDLVHYHLLFRLSGSLPMVTRELHIPSVAILHDYWLMCFAGHMIDSKMRECSGPESAEKCALCACGFEGEPRPDLVQLFRARGEILRSAYAHIDYVVSPSEFLARTHEKFGFAKPHILPYGLTPVKRLQRHVRDDSHVVFGFCGQIVARKGLDLLVAALLGIPERNWRLVVYGEVYEPQYFDMITGMTRGNPAIEYRGPFTAQDLPRIYSEIDVAVVPSRRENYPITLMEALSARVPAVAADVGGVREMMRDGEEGFVVPANDAAALAPALSAILRNPGMIDVMEAAIRPVKTMAENAVEMRVIYERMLHTNRSS